ncbi:hypothetical protein ACQPZA_17590 [Pseudonocardia xinjiangensis]|uniref:hypothetical protein n=1 Tax=Pseudonocardia xinjiangensis TaxID=75289 RepID=UPI003D90A9C3
MEKVDGDDEDCWAAVRRIGEALVPDGQGAGGAAFRAFLIYRAEHGGPANHGPTCGDVLDAGNGLGSVLAEINVALGLPPTTPASRTIRAARTTAAAARENSVPAAGPQPAGRAVYYGAVIGTSDKELTPEHETDDQ